MRVLLTAPASTRRSLAGEMGIEAAPQPGPGSLRIGLLDALHLMAEGDVLAGCKVEALA